MGGPRVPQEWLDLVVFEFLEAEGVQSGLCKNHLFQYVGVSGSTYYKTKHVFALVDEPITISSYCLLTNRPELRDATGVDLVVLLRKLPPLVGIVGGGTCCKQECRVKLKERDVVGIRSYVFSRPAVEWAFAASSLIFPWGERRLCNHVIKELWGFSWRKSKRIKAAVEEGQGYMTGNLTDRRSQREHVRRVLTDVVLELLYSFIDLHTSGGEDPTKPVRFMPVNGKKGLFRTLVMSTDIPIRSESTFKIGLKLFVVDRGLTKLQRRRKEHSLCKVCLDISIYEEQYRRHCAKLAKQGVVVDPHLVVAYNACVEQHAEHLASAKHRRDVAINLRHALLRSASNCPDFPAELHGDLGDELPQLFEPILVGDLNSDLTDGNLVDMAFGAHMDAKGDVDLPSFGRNTAGLAQTDRSSVHYYALAELECMVSTQFVMDKAHGGKNSSLHMDLLLLYMRLARGNRRVLVVILDNVSSNKCTTLIFFASFVVQAGFVRALVYLYLWPSHGKWLADGVFGLLESSVPKTDEGCMDEDDLCYMMDTGRREGDVDRRSRVVGLAARHDWTAVLDTFFDVNERAPRSHRILKVQAIVVQASDPKSAFFVYDGALKGADDLETSDPKALIEQHLQRVINEPRTVAAETPELVKVWKLPARVHDDNYREVLQEHRRAHDDPITIRKTSGWDGDPGGWCGRTRGSSTTHGPSTPSWSTTRPLPCARSTRSALRPRTTTSRPRWMRGWKSWLRRRRAN